MSEYQIEHSGYIVKPHNIYPSTYIIVTSGRGGKIPDVLSGMFTSKSIAINEIDRYVTNKLLKD